MLFEVVEGTHVASGSARIPAARWRDVQQMEQAPLWNKVPGKRLLAQLQALGIRHDSAVVLAGREQVANARVTHLLLYAGVRDVRLLDGGTAAWIDQGFSLTDVPAPLPAPVRDFGLHLPACPHYLPAGARWGHAGA